MADRIPHRKPSASYYVADLPMPCDSCANRRNCRVTGLECDDFRAYASTGRTRAEKKDSRIPTRESVLTTQAGEEYRRKKRAERAEQTTLNKILNKHFPKPLSE